LNLRGKVGGFWGVRVGLQSDLLTKLFAKSTQNKTGFPQNKVEGRGAVKKRQENPRNQKEESEEVRGGEKK